MIGTVTNPLSFSDSASALPSQAARSRRVGAEAGHALEKLGHAIEYLTDEFMNEDGHPLFRRDGRLEAIDILMAANRSIYFACPEVPTLRERLSTLIHRRA